MHLIRPRKFFFLPISTYLKDKILVVLVAAVALVLAVAEV